MFCPLCGAHLTRRELVERNSQYAASNVSVQYDVRCPHCLQEIGRMSWGEFKLDENLFAADAAPSRDELVKKEKPLIPPPPELRPLVRVRRRKEDTGPATETLPEPLVCPHCGKEIE